MTDEELIKVAKAVARLVDKWQLDSQEKIELIGFNPTTMAFQNSDELQQRWSLLLNIHHKLRLLFNNPQNVYGFMTMRLVNHNHPFNGFRPLDLAFEGLEGLTEVYKGICEISEPQR